MKKVLAAAAIVASTIGLVGVNQASAIGYAEKSKCGGTVYLSSGSTGASTSGACNNARVRTRTYYAGNYYWSNYSYGSSGSVQLWTGGGTINGGHSARTPSGSWSNWTT